MIVDRKKKLRVIQSILLIIALSIILYTYSKKTKSPLEFSQNQIDEKLFNDSDKFDIFFNIEYSGFDLSGNRYILNSKKAYSEKSNSEIVDMEGVKAIFYFKDGTELNIFSEKGLYNNKTLDMEFSLNVRALYGDSKLLAQKAQYSNKNNLLKISDNVVVDDIKGSMYAEEILFDISDQSLRIKSKKNERINTNINLKWKKVSEF